MAEVLKKVVIENDIYKIEEHWKRNHMLMFGYLAENRLLKNGKCIYTDRPFFEKDKKSKTFSKLEEIIKKAKSLNKKITY